MVTFSAGKSVPQLTEATVPLPSDLFYLVRGNQPFKISHTNLISTPNGYISGAELVFNSGTVLDVGVILQRSVVRSFDNTIDMPFTGILPLDFTGLGAGGLDVGAVVANTLYTIYVIGDSTGALAPNVIASLNVTTPALPGTYDKHRRIGTVLTDAATALYPFVQNGSGRTRQMNYDTGVANLIVLLAGNAVAFTPVSMAALLPPSATRALLTIDFNNSAAANELILGITGTAETKATSPHRFRPGSVTPSTFRIETIFPVVNQSLEYAVSVGANAATLAVAGYEDKL